MILEQAERIADLYVKGQALAKALRFMESANKKHSSIYNGLEKAKEVIAKELQSLVGGNI